jgi:hypothetical protein
MNVGHDLQLDDPEHPKGDNPDLIVTISGVRWAFACKMMMGASPVSLFDRIYDGVEQITRVAAPNGPIQRGIVVVSLKNRIDYDEFWPILNSEQYRNGEPPLFGVQPSAVAVSHRLRDIAERQIKEMEESATPEKVLELFSDSVAVPAVLLFLQVTFATEVPFATGAKTLPSIYHLLWPHEYEGVSAGDRSVFAAMYDALHNHIVSAGRPSE